MSQLDSTLHTTNDNLVYREQKESGVEVSNPIICALEIKEVKQ